MWNVEASTLGIFQSARIIPHTPSWGDWIVWTSALKVDVDGWEELEIYKGFGQTTSTCQGLYDGGIYGIPKHVLNLVNIFLIYHQS